MSNGSQQYLKLEHRLTLLAWLNSLLGYSSNRELLEDMKQADEGFDASGHSHIYHRLLSRGSKVHIPDSNLARYDENIRAHLAAVNARRRQARLQSRSEEDTSAVIQALIRADPTLAAVFGKGQTIKVLIGPLPEPEPYVGKQFPTFFRIRGEPKAGLVKACPLNRTCRVEFETDATNDYFSRSTDPGRLEVRGAPTRVGTVHLWNGKALLRFAPPASCSPGDQLRVVVLVSDVSRVAPFESSFIMSVEPEAPPLPPGPPAPPPGASLTGFPNISEVRREQWAMHGFDEISAVELKYGDDDAIDM